ncbi:MAG: glycosyltransferase [Niabella sp.]|nr:glycosyltransferase [Niabella sp.]
MNNVLDISYCLRTKKLHQKFSILLPSWNNLDYLKACVASILAHSDFEHQIIVHVNDGADGTLDWVKEQPGIDYTHSKENVGVCYALNAAARLAYTDYILYINDDMYVCPQWDQHLWKAVQEVGHDHFFISATAIERLPQSRCSIGKDYGANLEHFQKETLLREFDTLPMSDWMGATWPPNIVHKNVWDLVGGYSTEFSPGMYSDPDFSMKLWNAGVRYFKGIAASRVYHFGSLSVKRIKKNRGYYQFIRKWGLTAGTFSTYFLRRGAVYTGPATPPHLSFFLKMKSRFKALVAVFK